MTGNAPLVSVIINFLNEECFISAAIESVFAQTYDHWELILVDDGSTDRSAVIAQEYAAQHPDRVRACEHAGHTNQGMSASRNLGILHSRGDYIAFLDADDIWLPAKLEQQVAILNDHPEAAAVYGPTQWWYSWTGQREDEGRDFVHDLGVLPNTLMKPPELIERFLQNPGISPCICSVLIRHAAIQAVGGFEDAFHGMYEDQAFFAKLCLAAPVFVMGECLAKYRQHSNSNCARTRRAGQERAVRTIFLNWLASYLDQENIADTGVRRTLKQQLWAIRHPTLQRIMQRARYSTLGHVYRSARNLRLRWMSWPVIRHLRALQMRRLQPLANGRQRGTPIVRYYWARFLEQHRRDICGDALEIGATMTLRQYGSKGVTRMHAIDLTAHSPEITVVADLSRADHVPSDRYDCFINPFTLHLIYDVEAALYHSLRMLKPSGVLLANFPCVDYYFAKGLDMGTGAPLFLHWWFTPIQVENLLRRIGLTESDFTLEIYGNLFARIAYQLNLPAEELTRCELDFVDGGHPLLVCARVVKPVHWQAAKPPYRDAWLPATSPAHWNPVTGHYAA